MRAELDRELQQLQDELKQGTLSRRRFMNRLSQLGLGFGAAYVLGLRDAGAVARDVRVASTDPVLNGILSQGMQDPNAVTAQLPIPHPPPPLPHPPPPPYQRYDRQYSSYDRHEPPPYSRYDRTYARYDRTYPR